MVGLSVLVQVDKELLLFSGRGHLSAVSWLLQLGANARTTDSVAAEVADVRRLTPVLAGGLWSSRILG